MRIAEPAPAESVIEFPKGLPGLGELTRFVLLEPDGLGPIVLLQSLDDEHVSLALAPTASVHPEYELRLGPAELDVLGAATVDELASFAVLTLPGDGRPAACNLAAPVVLNPVKRLGAQVLQTWNTYPTVHRLPE